MDQDFEKPVFYRAIMTSVFVGIFMTVATLAFDLLFIENTDFPYSEIINVSSLIFAVNLFFLVIGVIYYGVISSSRFGDIVFIAVFVLLTVFLVIKTAGIERTADQALNIEFRHLLSGIIVIVGVGVCLLVPLLFHSKKFEKHVL